MSTSSKTLITCDEFEKLAPTLGPCELIDGEIVPLAPGGFDHSHCSFNFVLQLGNFVKKKKLGWVLTNEAGVRISDKLPRVRGADVIYIRTGACLAPKRPTDSWRLRPN